MVNQWMYFIIGILKIARQCKFPDMDDRIIDAIIFGTNCIKAQDKLLQTPKNSHFAAVFICCKTL